MGAAWPHGRMGNAQGCRIFALLVISPFLHPVFSSCQQIVPQHKVTDVVVARVNGVPVLESSLQDEIENLYPVNSAHGGLRPEKLQEVRSQAAEELIVRELAYQQAVKDHTVVPLATAQAEFNRLRTAYGGEKFDRSLRASGVTRKDYTSRIQRSLTLEKIYKAQVVQPAQVSPEALHKYYDQNPKKFVRPEQVHVRIFLAEFGEKATPEEVGKAKSKADNVYSQLQAGKDFGALATQFSDDAYRVKGGDLGWVHRGRLDPEFEKVAFSLKPGETSKPFRTTYGFSILKVEAHEPGRQMTFAEVSPMLQQELVQKNTLELRHAWIAGLKKNAKIEILDKGINPAAASIMGAAG